MAGIALVFPGQGSQKPGMGREFYEQSESTRRVFDVVSDALGLDLPEICFNSDEDTLRQTENTQIALFTVSMAAYETGKEQFGSPIAMAGHSVGEYAALTASGVLTIEDGAKLVRKRGELMSRSGAERVGGMAAVLGLDDGAIEAVCKAISKPGHEVVIANSNCPGQTVISGDKAAVDEASVALKEAGAKRCLPLNVSGAFHSPLMVEAASLLAEELRRATFGTGSVPVISNVTAKAETDWASLLERQLFSRVRWAESILEMRSLGCDRFIECGSGEVLTGLLKRIDAEAQGISFSQPNALQGAPA